MTDGLVVETGGVGYRITVPATVLSDVGTDGSEVFLWIHTHVREDAIVLYGFITADQRRCFGALIGAHGVGPSLALAILGAHSPHDLRRAIMADDVDALMLVPGVGRKTAARLLVELKERLDLPELIVDSPNGLPVGVGSTAEVKAALGALGYQADEVRRALEAVDVEGDTEVMLRAALRELAAAR
ncbi:MAG: Holliday junction branch migration protein RuvA [Acidimicrobiales bacterium]